MNPTILKAARELREDIEAFAFYWSRARGAEINCERLENGQLSMMGACGIASWVLWRALKRAGYVDAEMVAGWYRIFCEQDLPNDYLNHCWVTVEGQLIDLTATQFGVPEAVYVTDPGQDKNYMVLNLEVLYSETSYSIRKYMADVGAPCERRLMDWESQSPFRRDYRPDLQVMEDKCVAILEGRDQLREAA